MRTSEKIPFSLGDTTKKALGGVALTLALLGAGEVYDSQPAEAQTLGEETDSEYAFDCYHGHYPIWVADFNNDRQPGPSPSEFTCRALYGCHMVELMPSYVMGEFERAGVISPPSPSTFGSFFDRLGRCQGEPYPEFEDYREHLDAYPWIEENIERILAIPLWHSDEIKVSLSGGARHTWWWKRVYGQDALDTDTSETQPTTETTSESTTDQATTDIDDPATEAEASSETETTTDTSETQPTTETTSESTTDQATTDIDDSAAEAEASSETETTTDTSETQPTTETTSESTTDQATTDIDDTAAEAEASPETETTSDTSETQPTTETTSESTTDQATTDTNDPAAETDASPETETTTDTSETQPTTDTTSESTTDQGTTDITDTATEPEPQAETTTDTSEVLTQDGYLNRNKIAIFAGGTAILAVLGIATWRRKKVS